MSPSNYPITRLLNYQIPIAAVAVALLVTLTAASREGHLVLLGGGETPSAVFQRTLALSGGREAIVAVLPQTYPNDSIGDAAVALWKQLHAREVLKVSRTDPAAARAAIERATLIWMPGGFQGLLMHTIANSGIPSAIRARFAAGVTIGGASAGAAAMSATMIADESTPDGLNYDGPATEDGLGLWPEAIISPHFSERQRMSPLMAIVEQHQNLFGVGIDEGTAVIASEGTCEVIGRGTVVIVVAGAVRRLTSGMRFSCRRTSQP